MRPGGRQLPWDGQNGNKGRSPAVPFAGTPGAGAPPQENREYYGRDGRQDRVRDGAQRVRMVMRNMRPGAIALLALLAGTTAAAGQRTSSARITATGVVTDLSSGTPLNGALV